MNNALLKKILSQPTAPFREKQVVSLLQEELNHYKVKYFMDPIGNVVIGVGSKQEYLALLKKQSKEPVRVFVAHMDHPGFHGVNWKTPNQLKIQWHGGSPRAYLKGAKVWLADSSGWVGEGAFHSVKLNASKTAIETGVIKIAKNIGKSALTKASAKELYGGFAFRAPVWQDGKLIYTKAADDLVGVFSIVSMAIAQRAKKNSPFVGLITRAEEVGFIGAIAHFELGWLQTAKRRVVCISLETSRTLPGAIVGQGPVVRLGDKATPFDPGLIEVMTSVAKKILPKKFQRRIMDGGTCEATAATVFGLKAMGISVPLGNYHNQSLEGGPDARKHYGPAPEFVHLDDIQGMLKLCDGLMAEGLAWERPWVKHKTEFIGWRKSYQKLLELT